MPGFLEILKRRWPEVTLVIVFQAGITILFLAVMPQEGVDHAKLGSLPAGMDFVLGFGTVMFAILWQMIYLGFLRTACTHGCTPHEPMELVKIGRPYFWRMVRFQFALGFLYFLALAMILTFLSLIMPLDKDLANFPEWLASSSSFAAIAILAKPLLLMPAIMIGYNCMVRQSLVLLKKFRLLDAGNLLKIFFVCFGSISVLSYIQSTAPGDSIFYYTVSGTYAVCSSILLLILSLSALRFIVAKTDLIMEHNLTTVNNDCITEDTEEQEVKE